MKRSAVDCAINKALNLNNIPKHEQYECNDFDKKLENYTEVDIDMSTFDNVFLSPYIDYTISIIKDLFKTKSIIYHKDILKIPELKQLKVNDNNYIIEKALYELTPKKHDLSTFYHIFEGKQEEGHDKVPFGYIIARKISDKETVYIFQELDSEKKVRSIFEQLPMYHRRNFYLSNDPIPLKREFNNLKQMFRQSSSDKITSVQTGKRVKIPRKVITKIAEENDSNWRNEAEVVAIELKPPTFGPKGNELWWIRYNRGDPKTRPIPPSNKYKPGVRCDNLQSASAKIIKNLLMDKLNEFEPDNRDFDNLNKTKKPKCDLLLKLLKHLNKIDKKFVWYKRLSSVLKK